MLAACLVACMRSDCLGTRCQASCCSLKGGGGLGVLAGSCAGASRLCWRQGRQACVSGVNAL